VPASPASPAWRTLARLAIVAAVFGVCFDLLVWAIGPRSPWLGLLSMFYFLGLAKVAAPLVRLRMPRRLRAVGPGEVGLYRRLGVRGFGAVLRHTPLRRLNTSVYLAGGCSLAELSLHAEAAEATHFWAALLFTPWIAYVWSRGLVAVAVFFLLVQAFFNVYPILHLRLVRARLCRFERVARARAEDPGDACRLAGFRSE
jgi:hypothetical protein